MEKRVFSKQTYNGYHIVHWSGIGDPTPLGFFKKLKEKDECGFMADTTEDAPQCPSSGRMRWAPWDNWLYVPSDCQGCMWVYRTRGNDYNRLLKTRERINPHALIKGGP